MKKTLLVGSLVIGLLASPFSLVQAEEIRNNTSKIVKQEASGAGYYTRDVSKLYNSRDEVEDEIYFCDENNYCGWLDLYDTEYSIVGVIGYYKGTLLPKK